MKRERLLFAFALLAPLAGAQLMRFVPLGRAPAKAAAAGTSAGPRERSEVNPYSFEIPKLDANEVNNPVAKLYRTAHQKSFERVPVAVAPHAKAAVNQTQAARPMETPDEKMVEALNAVKGLELTSVLSGREPVAIIGGRALRVGMTVKKGWKLAAIDLARNTATIEHAVAGRQELALKRKAAKEESAIESVPR